MPEAIRVKTLSGKWETFGVERRPSILPDQPHAVADQGGSATLGFTLARESSHLWGDLVAWSPVEYEVDGVVVWDGKIKDTPAQSGSSIVVNCVGWQADLDSDSYQGLYVHNNLSDWKDTRLMPGAVIGSGTNQFTAVGQIGSEGLGYVTLGYPKGTSVQPGVLLGLTLDLGPTVWTNRVEAIFMDWLYTSGGYGGIPAGDFAIFAFTAPQVGMFPTGKLSSSYCNFFGGAGESSYHTAQYSGLPEFVLGRAAGGLTTSAGPYRYVQIFLKNLYTQAVTLSEDIYFRLRQVQLFCNNSWMRSPRQESGLGVSNLRATDVVVDAVSRGAPLLSAQPASPSYAAEVTADEMLDYWSFDGAAAPVLDQGPGYGAKQHPLALGVTPTFGQPSLLVDDTSTGAKFNGSSQYLVGTSVLPPPSGTSGAIGVQGFSAEAIIKPEEVSRAAGVFAIQGGCWELGMRATGKVAFVLVTNSGTISIASPENTLVNGGTYHVVGTYDYVSGAAYLYVNNVQVASTNLGVRNPIIGTTEPFLVGTNSTSSFTQAFKGVVQKLVTYACALTGGAGSQIDQHYKAAFARQYGTVQRTQFDLPGYWPTTARTPRAHIDAVDSVHLYRKKVLIGQKFLYAPQASVVRLKADAAVEFVDGAANDGENIYSKVIVEGNNAIGEEVRVALTAAELYRNTAFSTSTGVAQAANPNAETALVTGQWSAGVTRDATHVHSGTEAFKFTSEELVNGELVGPMFRAGHSYRVRVWVYTAEVKDVEIVIASGNFLGGGGGYDSAGSDGASLLTGSSNEIPKSQWVLREAIWTPKANHLASAVTLTIRAGYSSTGTVWFDDVSIEEIQATVVERQGSQRSKVLTASSPIDEQVAEALAAAFLKAYSVTPFKGSFIAGPGDVTWQVGGEWVPPANLLIMGGELIRIPVIDPDTGAYGRDGKIAQVTWDPASRTCSVAVDDDRANFQALVQRMAVIQSGSAS